MQDIEKTGGGARWTARLLDAGHPSVLVYWDTFDRSLLKSLQEQSAGKQRRICFVVYIRPCYGTASNVRRECQCRRDTTSPRKMRDPADMTAASQRSSSHPISHPSILSMQRQERSLSFLSRRPHLCPNIPCLVAALVVWPGPGAVHILIISNGDSHIIITSGIFGVVGL